jgi:hypothetical protein
MVVQVAVAVVAEVAAVVDEAEVVVVTAMGPGHRAAKVTVIGVASRGTGPGTVAANSARRRKRSEHLRSRRRNLQFCSLRLSPWSHRRHTGLAAAGRSRAVMWVLVCKCKGAGVLAGRSQVLLVCVFQSDTGKPGGAWWVVQLVKAKVFTTLSDEGEK